MVKVKIDLDIESIADALANSSDKEQSKFFNIFFKSLKMSCESNYLYDLQKHSISNMLDKNAKDAINFMFYED